MTTSNLPAARFEDRLRRAQLLLPENDASALLIGWGTDLLWLTGYEAAASERLTMLVLPAEGKPTLVVPRLERSMAEVSPAVGEGKLDVATWEETDDPFDLVARLLGAAGSKPAVQMGALGGAWGQLGSLLVSDRLFASFLLRLQDVVPDAAFGLASARHRMCMELNDPRRGPGRVVSSRCRTRLPGYWIVETITPTCLLWSAGWIRPAIQ